MWVGGDFDQPVDLTRGVLNIHERPVRCPEVEVQPGELRTRRAVRRPSCQAFSRVEQVTVLVQVNREPDVVIRTAASVFDNVDVALGVDGQVVGVSEASANRQVRRKIDGLWRCEQSDDVG